MSRRSIAPALAALAAAGGLIGASGAMAEAAADWSTPISTALAQEGTSLVDAQPTDIADFCPGYAALNPDQRQQFWTGFVSVLVDRESGGDADRTRFRPYDVDAARPVFARGLLQLSIESSRRGDYACGLAAPAELDDPIANLDCGVKILTRRIEADGIVAGRADGAWRGAARVWPSLRQPASALRAAIEARDGQICSSTNG